MPEAVKKYVRCVDAVNRVVGRFAMYMVFAMMGLLLYSAITKTFFIPPLWTLEMAQFSMAAYYMLGGAYSMQLDAHVRMDLVYGRWSSKGKGSVICKRSAVYCSVRKALRGKMAGVGQMVRPLSICQA